MTVNYLKAGLAALCVISVVVLMAIGSITGESGLPIITLVVGYSIGNGVTSKAGNSSEPIIGPKDQS